LKDIVLTGPFFTLDFGFEFLKSAGMRTILLALICVFILFACSNGPEIPETVQAALDKLPDDVNYNTQVKPVLSDRCFKCHGPDKNKVESGLQLTNFESATQKLESEQSAIVPGNLERSELIRRILSADPEEMMPPPASHLTLSDEEKALLIKWIESGAQYQEHWSLTGIETPKVPRVGKNWISKWGIREDQETTWVQNEIDNFSLVKMKEQGLNPNGKADKNKLLRRVYMDLTGLPPSVAEVNSFLKDNSSNAFEKVVDKLLASPHFGEQQAITWLDVARYADTHGYQDDGMRNVYPYRDWVIQAFNQNLPFDKFVKWQLAGDLMPNATREMIIATSFNRQHAQSQEGGIVVEEYLTEYVADRTNTFGKAFLGLTMECARCHDHKYDPISNKDYYSLFAFFNQNKEYGEVPYNGEAAPTLLLTDRETEEKVRYIRENIAIQEKGMKAKASATQDGFNTFRAQARSQSPNATILKRELLVHLDFENSAKDKYPNRGDRDIEALLSGDADRRPLMVSGKHGNAVELRGDCGIQLIAGADRKAKETSDRFYKGLNFERNQPFTISFWFKSLEAGLTGPLITKNNGEFEGFRGYDIELNTDETLSVRMMYVYPSNGIELRTNEKISVGEWHHTLLSYDGSAKAEGLKLFLDGKPANVKILSDNLTKSILHGEKKSNWNFSPFEIGKNFRSSIEKVQFDELRIYKRRLSALEAEALYRNDDTVSLESSEEKLYEYYLWNVDENFARHQEQLSSLRFEETQVMTDVPEVMVMLELPPDQQRKTHVLNRGAYDSPGAEVTAETPLRLGKLPSHYPRNRLGLAQWLLDEENPLFARVMVNRFWMQFFGNGLVKTQEDFGNQGNYPTHPELLDWLAAKFREDHWDVKKFVKRIVMSATYQQSSVADATTLEKDPENAWLARGPSYRYSAEQVRDNALAASGLLARKIGGPSVYPYQPGGIWEALATRNAVSYTQQHGDSLYRRSMYTIWKRSSPPPMMLIFDAADRSLCAVRRQRTATPLQALVTMNDPQFVEAARVMAERSIRSEKTVPARISWFFLAAVSREPRAAELEAMEELLALELKHFKEQPVAASKLLKTGDWPTDNSLEPSEVAAYTVVANTILNYDEALVKR
jgi:hypothetical protein